MLQGSKLVSNSLTLVTIEDSVPLACIVSSYILQFAVWDLGSDCHSHGCGKHLWHSPSGHRFLASGQAFVWMCPAAQVGVQDLLGIVSLLQHASDLDSLFQSSWQSIYPAASSLSVCSLFRIAQADARLRQPHTFNVVGQSFACGIAC